MSQNPLILTLALNPTAEEYFTRLRDRYFPPERNFLKVHLTLFHHLPAEATVVKEVEADREIERAEVEIKEEEDEGILERTGEQIDQEVNKEVNEEIDNIGDDNSN